MNISISKLQPCGTYKLDKWIMQDQRIVSLLAWDGRSMNSYLAMADIIASNE